MLNKKTIIVSAPTLQYLSGGTKFLLEICAQLNKKYKLILASKTDNEKISEELKKNHIALISRTRFVSNFYLYWLMFPFSLSYELINLLLITKKNDILISFLFPSNFICSLVSIIKNVPHFHYSFEPYPYLKNKRVINQFYFPKKQLFKIYSFIFSWLDTFGVKNPIVVFTLNQITQKMIKKIYGRDSVVTLMGVDTQHFKLNNDKQFAQYQPYVVHSTDYTITKHTDLAIKTFAKTQSQKLKLLITSTRPEASEKVDLIKLVTKLGLSDRVFFLDLIDYNLLPKLYSQALCYLSCSYDEMMGTTSSNLPVKEALACGTPAIRANITTEDVEDGVSGYLVDPRKTSAVAKKIEFLHSHPQIAKQMGLVGRKKIVKLYQWENVAKKILDNLKEAPND